LLSLVEPDCRVGRWLPGQDLPQVQVELLGFCELLFPGQALACLRYQTLLEDLDLLD
jgi:hypothetical protein